MHITGTNGKGSTAAFTASILSESGYKTGLFTSPHLSDVRERIKIGSENIGRNEFASALETARAAYDELGLTPSFFEIMFVIASLHFYTQGCDFVIAEVGIGGRLDSTNALEGVVCAITGVDFDHMEYLGGTLREIAREKTAIVKPGAILVVNVDDDGLYGFIEKEALERGASRVARVGDLAGGRITAADKTGTDFIIESPSFRGVSLRVPLVGDYQFQNARCAVSIIEALRSLGLVATSADELARGFAKTFWPGRFELLEKGGAAFLLDGAHNVNGMTGFVRNLRALFAGKRIRAIISILSNKQYDRMLEIIAGAVDEIVVVGINNFKKKNVEVKALVENARRHHDRVVYLGDVKTALEYSIGSPDCDLTCVTGSLYLVGEARERLLEKEKAGEIGRMECVSYEPRYKA